jgi:hypothetical protein
MVFKIVQIMLFGSKLVGSVKILPRVRGNILDFFKIKIDEIVVGNPATIKSMNQRCDD